MVRDIVAAICLGWYFFILAVCSIGVAQIWKNFSKKPPRSVSINLPLSAVPHVTIIRPVKGIEPRLYECLAATFYQAYAISKLTIFFCISSRDDPAFPILERLIIDFPTHDVRILVEEEDPNLSGLNGNTTNLGPNPKIRNMSRAYREAKGDILWIIDCNVWVDQSTAGRLVDLLCGFAPTSRDRKYKFVHQLPLAIDISHLSGLDWPSNGMLLKNHSTHAAASGPSLALSYLGGRLEEMFLSTSHAKFYTAIAAVAVAPCTVGKSNMFRRSHLNALTASASYRDPGIDYFSENICEDHLISDLLWKTPVPDEIRLMAEREGQGPGSPIKRDLTALKWGNHGLLSHSLAIQPTSYLPLHAYLARRTRWLRVRKFTVPLATLVEPGTESLLCSAYGAFGLTTLPWCNEMLGIPGSWFAFFTVWLLSVMVWGLVDTWVYVLLQNSGALNASEEVPSWVKRERKRGWSGWLSAWIGREMFAFPIWLWAVVGGVTVSWRGRRFWVGMDMKVHEIDAKGTESKEDMGLALSIDRHSTGSGLRGGAASNSKDLKIDPLAVDGDDSHMDSKSWEIPVVSLKLRSHRLPKKNCSHMPLNLGYNAETTTLYVKNDSTLRVQADMESDGMREPLLAIARFEKHSGEVKLVPCPQDSDAQAVGFEIVLGSVEATRMLVERLLKTGCSMMQIPGKYTGFGVGPETVLRDLAMKLPISL
ncbi:MAG: hypothetical protein Q9184_006296 [Pyrenodesmia sp. 2 TL-2023]